MDKVLGCDYVGLEGYAYGASGRAIFQIAENCGLLKYKLWEAGIAVDIIPPTKVKKDATGKGNADKRKMVDAFELDTGCKSTETHNAKTGEHRLTRFGHC